MKPKNKKEQRNRYLFWGIISYIMIQFYGFHYGQVTANTVIERFLIAFDHMQATPFDIFPIDKKILLATGFYGLLVPTYFYGEYLKRRDLRPAEENGSARWNENLKKYYEKYAEVTYWPKIFDSALLKPLKIFVNSIDTVVSKIPLISSLWNAIKNSMQKKFVRPDDTPGSKNMIFSKEIAMSMDTRKTRRNNNVMVIGGSGTGKSRFLVKPNLLQVNSSYVITDPSGELLETEGAYLERNGYEVRVFNLVQMEHSNCYNPFNYIRDEQGVITMITALVKNTTAKGSQSSDPFWEKAETALLQALCYFLVSECNPEDRNYGNVMELLRCAEVKDGQDDFKSTLDILFEDLEKKNPNHIAVRQYAVFKSAGGGKTAQSILITCQTRLQHFNLESIQKLTGTDDIDLGSLGDKKVALFCITPTADTSFNFLVSMMYTQLFETLYHHAETKCKGKRLKYHVRFMLDEFANIGTIPDFEQKLSTMRKYEISCTIIIQALAQLKTMYKDGATRSVVKSCGTC